MRKTKIWFAGLVAGIMVLAGASFSCTPSPSVSEVTSQPADSKPYGSLTIGAAFPAGPLDPMYNNVAQFSLLGAAIWDSLTTLTPDINGPAVAERWDISSDGLTHTFYLLKGVKFHDDTDLTAADVKFSIDRMMSPKSITQSYVDVWRDKVDRVEVKDDYTVAIHLKKPSYYLLDDTTRAMGAIMPKRLFDEKGEEYFQKTLVGSGPWKVVSYRPGQELVLEAVDTHWRAVPKFKNLTIKNVPEEAVKIAMLRTGELDVAVVSSDAIRGLKAAGLRVLTYPGGSAYWGPVLYDVNNPRQHAIGDVRVRKALQLAINQRELADSFFSGAGAPYFLNGMPYAILKKMKPDPFDPEGAKKLLAEAGYPNGFTTRIIDVGSGGLLSRLCAAVGGYWEKIGVRANNVPMEYGAYRSLYRTKLDPSLFDSINIYSGSGGPMEAVSNLMFHTKLGVFHNINNPELDKLLDRIPMTRDPVERERLNTEAAVLARNEYNMLAVVATDVVVAYGPRVGGVAPSVGATEMSALQYETITHAK